MENNTIKSTSYSQEEIIKNILQLHCDGKDIDLDPTYSKGVFYKNINPPKHKFDLYPQVENVIQADCRHLPIEDDSTNVIMFDPPFVIGQGPSLQNDVKGQSIIQKRFSGFKNSQELIDLYFESLNEFFRILKKGGTLIFKCQDVVASGKQILSHVIIMNLAEVIGYYIKDLFILNAKNRLISGKIKKTATCKKIS